MDSKQELKDYNIYEFVKIKINKTINSDSIEKTHGNPSFIFKIIGKDINNEIKVTLYRIITFSEFDKKYNKEKITKSLIITGLEKYNYEITEEKTFRYEVNEIINVTDNIKIDNKKAVIDFTTNNDAEVTFTSKKIGNSLLTDSKLLVDTL